MSQRQADHAIDADILARWSPRAFDGGALNAGDLAPLFEAARWAPSAYNYQPWRFVYALRGDGAWEGFVDALLPFNASWASKAGALVFVLSDTFILPPGGSEPVPATTASFDSGAAWAYFALQAAKQGLASHAMAGFDTAKAADATGAGERYKVEVAIAVGRSGDPASLPDGLRAREVPSSRLNVRDIAFAGSLPA